MEEGAKEAEAQAEEAASKIDPIMLKAQDCSNRLIAQSAKILEPFMKEQAA